MHYVDESTIVDSRNDGKRESDENARFVNLCPQSYACQVSVTFVEPYKKIACLLWETSSRFFVRAAKLDVMPKNVNKLLVANRGEIALRVVRTAREMGIPTVAVYAEQDRHAQYVQMADDAYLLSGDTYKDTYLNEDLLIDILQRSGADAVHPGYGFLSEVATFAQKVIDAGAAWVGPNPKALVDLGDKITARRVATFAKVPPVPGISQSISDMRLLLDFAHTHGYPLMLKRTDGGRRSRHHARAQR